MNGYTSSLIGFFLGLGFGVGCALAVMYSVYMGGYRAAVSESLLAEPPERMVIARSKAIAIAARELAEKEARAKI